MIRVHEHRRWSHSRQLLSKTIYTASRSIVWYIVVPIGIVLALPAWFAFGIVAIAMGVSASTYYLATVPIIVAFSLLLGFAVWQRTKPPVAGSDPPVPWRLCDPQLSHWGVWRAELEQLPEAIEGFRNRKQVKQFIRTIMSDWSTRSARGGWVVRISKPVPPTKSPFEDGLNALEMYRITLEDHLEHRSTGWLRFGEGWVEFQLCKSPNEFVFFPDAHETPEKPERANSLTLRSLSDWDPLWDPWLDG